MPSTVGMAEPNTFWPGTLLVLGAPSICRCSLFDCTPVEDPDLNLSGFREFWGPAVDMQTREL